jgi:proton-translocating NADH-quinone oxidoreductase chain L
MMILIVFLPLLGFFSGILFGRFLGKGVCFVTTFLLFLSFFLSFITFIKILSTGSSFKILLGSWIYVDSLNVEWAFYFDSLTSIMLIVVTFISMLVHLYSTEYMESDPHLNRFMAYLSLFTFFMLILITANNFLQMFVGWEGVGLSSYLLINFWFTRIQANKSAIKAMLINRIGDFFILLGLFLIYITCNSLDYDVVFNLSKDIKDIKINFLFFEIKSLDLICLFIFLGAMGKSAQLGLHVWLPDAMEGPTPVSALIHAATMVTAGVFLITRCSFLFELSPFVLKLVTIIGSLTAFFAATTGLFQNDIKKVIAYSTCSQLGYMIFACGLSSYNVSIFHLFNHAFFKALLFLGAGSIIHAISNEQDMRKMGGLKQILPFSYTTALIGSLALIGFPFLAGFYSKDVILEIAFTKYTNLGHFSYVLGAVSAFFTAFYSTRLIYLVFLVEPNGNKVSILNAHEGSWKMTLPLQVLACLSLFIGFISKDLFVGFGTDFWSASIYTLPVNYLLIDIEFLKIEAKLFPLKATLLGILLAVCYLRNLEKILTFKKTKEFKVFYNFFNKKWYFDKIYNGIFGKNFLSKSYFLVYQYIDRGLLEIIGPHGIVFLITRIITYLKFYQNGNIIDYVFLFLKAIIMIISFFFILGINYETFILYIIILLMLIIIRSLLYEENKLKN